MFRVVLWYYLLVWVGAYLVAGRELGRVSGSLGSFLAVLKLIGESNSGLLHAKHVFSLLTYFSSPRILFTLIK